MDAPFALEPDPAGPGSSGDVTASPRAGGALPAVVAVVVTHNPGEWFEEALASLADQDYPNLSILVVDAASDVDPTPRIAAIAPRAYVRRLRTNPGFGAAANNALHMVEGSPFFLICHDDVALAPNAVRLLVEEAYRSNAGVVGPKITRWDDVRALLSVGMGADRFGAPFPLCERGELDQEQHDGVRDVFFVPSAAFLIRSDLLRALGGFDEAIRYHGEDLDLCWRAHVAGARVLVAPSARVRHVEAMASRRADDRRRLQARHRLRMVLSNYGWFYVLGELVQQLVLTVAETLLALVTGHPRHAVDLLGAWVWNARRVASVLAKRRRVAGVRGVTDLEVRHLHVRGSARLTRFLRGQISGNDVDATLGDFLRQWAVRRSEVANRFNVSVVLGLTVLLLVGSRDLLTHSVPAVGEMVLWPDRARDLLPMAWSGWLPSGLGSAGVPPTGLGLMGLAGLVGLGATGLVRAILVLGTVPLGLLGVWRLGAAGPQSRVKAATTLAYAANPLPYAALAVGNWRGLALYALLPWIVLAGAQAVEMEPFSSPQRRPRVHAVAVVALLCAALVALYPAALLIVVLTVVAVAIGSALTGEGRRGATLVAVVGCGALVGALLHAPWLLSGWSNHDPAVRAVGELNGAHSRSLSELARFGVGPHLPGWVAWGMLAAGAAGLAYGRGWRLAWALRGWCLYTLPLLLVAVVQAGWIDRDLPAAEVLLVPGALGLALAVGASMAAFDLDLPAYRFGWRQPASALAALGLALSLLGPLVGSLNGSWGLPRGGHDRVLGFFQAEADEVGPFRVLWLGTPELLPAAGWPLGDGVSAYATSAAYPSVEALWAGPETTALQSIPQALTSAREGGHNRLGQRLGVLGVRYVVVVDQLAPAPFEGLQRPAATWLDATLSGQLDLAEVELNAGFRLYRNTAWLPHTFLLPPGVDQLNELAFPDTESLSAPALRPDGYQRYVGTLPDGAILHLSEAFDPGWEVEVSGETVAPVPGFEVMDRFELDQGGAARLSHGSRRSLLVLTLAQWLVSAGLAGLVLRNRRQVRPARAGTVATPVLVGRLGPRTMGRDPGELDDHEGPVHSAGDGALVLAPSARDLAGPDDPWPMESDLGFGEPAMSADPPDPSVESDGTDDPDPEPAEPDPEAAEPDPEAAEPDPEAAEPDQHRPSEPGHLDVVGDPDVVGDADPLDESGTAGPAIIDEAAQDASSDDSTGDGSLR